MADLMKRLWDRLVKEWWMLPCRVGMHGKVRTGRSFERRCPTCGGLWYGRAVETRTERTLGDWQFYSPKELEEIEKAGEIEHLRCGTGRFSG